MLGPLPQQCTCGPRTSTRQLAALVLHLQSEGFLSIFCF